MSKQYLVAKAVQREGLGDRIRGIATGILYAKLTGRHLAVDWRDGLYADRSVNAFHHLYTLNNILSADISQVSGRFRPQIWEQQLDRIPRELEFPKRTPKFRNWKEMQAFLSCDMGRMDHSEDALVYLGFDGLRKIRPLLTGDKAHLSKKSGSEILGPLIREHLKLQEPIRKEIAQWKTQHFDRPTVGVHARKTKVRSSKIINLPRVHRLLRHYITRLQEPTIFLATDNSDVIAEFKDRYKKVVVRDKWFGTPGEPIETTTCLDKLQNAKDALVEMYLLAECDYLIYPAYSSFSKISAMLSSAPSQNIIPVVSAQTRIKHVSSFAKGKFSQALKLTSR